jgi:hypothetical protein
MMIGTNGLAFPHDDVGVVAGKTFKAGCAVFRFVDLARAEAMQQLAHDPAHMRVIVNHEKAQTMKIDADHDARLTGTAWTPHRTSH